MLAQNYKIIQAKTKKWMLNWFRMIYLTLMNLQINLISIMRKCYCLNYNKMKSKYLKCLLKIKLQKMDSGLFIQTEGKSKTLTNAFQLKK